MKYIICNITVENDVNRGKEFLKSMEELDLVVIDSYSYAFQVAYQLMDKVGRELPSVSMRVVSAGKGVVFHIFSEESGVAHFVVRKLYRLELEKNGNFNCLPEDDNSDRKQDDSERCLGELRSGEGELLLSELEEVKSYLINVSQRLEEDADLMMHLISTVDNAGRVLTRLIEPSAQG